MFFFYVLKILFGVAKLWSHLGILLLCDSGQYVLLSFLSILRIGGEFRFPTWTCPKLHFLPYFHSRVGIWKGRLWHELVNKNIRRMWTLTMCRSCYLCILQRILKNSKGMRTVVIHNMLVSWALRPSQDSLYSKFNSASYLLSLEIPSLSIAAVLLKSSFLIVIRNHSLRFILSCLLIQVSTSWSDLRTMFL